MRPVIHLVAGARPNFMKVAPLYHALVRTGWCTPVLVHTGQHYDESMSQAFLSDLGLPVPSIALEVGSGHHGQQTARVLERYEAICLQLPPDVTVVVGDVNSTMACALAAAKLQVPVVHLEAGLRSRDRTMPEEINRIVTDAVSELLWTPSADADDNLLREGVPADRIERIGNVMIDSYELLRPRIEAANVAKHLGFQETGTYALVTLHRPSNVDDHVRLSAICGELISLSKDIPLVFPIHPRTRNQLQTAGLLDALEVASAITLTPPLGYIEFMSLVAAAGLVITDSGGIQEETSYLGIRCLTLRPSTERPVTVDLGTNRLVEPAELGEQARRELHRSGTRRTALPLWDGHAAERADRSLRRMLAS